MEDIKEKLQEIGQDVKILHCKIHGLDKIAARNQIILEEHIRRTEASEARIEKIEDRMVTEKIFHGTFVALVIAIAEILRRFL